ncbi:RNA recognition motif domain-containing protein [Flaviaesturariibacter terrae]
MKIYVANFPGSVTSSELNELFTPFGSVGQTEIAMDAFTGVSRGFGYVTMADEAGAGAVASLNGSDWQGHKLTVEEAPTLQNRGSYKVGTGPITNYRFRGNGRSHDRR